MFIVFISHIQDILVCKLRPQYLREGVGVPHFYLHSNRIVQQQHKQLKDNENNKFIDDLPIPSLGECSNSPNGVGAPSLSICSAPSGSSANSLSAPTAALWIPSFLIYSNYMNTYTCEGYCVWQCLIVCCCCCPIIK